MRKIIHRLLSIFIMSLYIAAVQASDTVQIVPQTGHAGSVNAVAYSPDGRRIVSGGNDHTIRVWDAKSGKLLQRLEGHTNYVLSVAYSPDGQRIVSGSDDGGTKIWKPKNGQLIITLLGLKDGEWIIYTPGNYYMASPNGDQYVAFRVNNNVYGVDQYAALYKQPEIISAALQGQETQRLVNQIKQETGMEQLSINELRPPVVMIQYLKGQNDRFLKPKSQTVGDSIVKVFAKAIDDKYGIDRVDVLLNGKLIKTIAGSGKNTLDIEVPITLSENQVENRIEMIAHSVKFIKSKPERVLITYDRAIMKGWSLPKLADYIFGDERSWAVIIGIDEYPEGSGYEPLPYAVNDAKAVQELLTVSLGFAEDRVLTLYDEEATRKNIERLMGDELPNKVSDGDRVIFFFSGHGATKPTRNANQSLGYLVPVDGKRTSLHSTALSMNQLHTYSELIPARQMLFVADACYSGILGTVYKKNAAVTEQTRKQVELFIRNGGRQIMTAGAVDEVAMMSSKWDNHSVYTYYFIKGLQGEADYNNDRVVTTLELQNYLVDEVPKETNNRQNPQHYRPGLGEGQFVFYREGDL